MSKVVLKISFKHPNMKSTSQKNVAHIKYIATRPGADKTLTENDLVKELEEGISENKESEINESDNDLYAKYIDERPNSHGLFGEDGAEDLNYIQEEIKNHESFVWRGIISLKEEDATELGFLSKSKWQDTLRTKVPDIAYSMGISPSNLKWVGAVHMEKGHPHAHIMFWEKEPKKINGVISKNTLNAIRKDLVDDIFEEQRLNLLLEKNTMRDVIQDLAKGDVSKANKLQKEFERTNSYSDEIKIIDINSNLKEITPRLYPEEEKELSKMINELSSKLPGKGRAMLKFMSPEIKEEIRNIADYILKQPEFEKHLSKNLKATEELTKLYTTNKKDIEKARENAYNDIRDRISQIILKGTVSFNKIDYFKVNDELAKSATDFLINNSGRLRIELEHQKVIEELSRKLASNGFETKDIKNGLLDYKQQHNLLVTDEKINFLATHYGYKDELSERLNYKKINEVISNSKLLGKNEDDAYTHAGRYFKSQAMELKSNLDSMVSKGLLKNSKNGFALSKDGIEELLKTKDLNQLEKEIFKDIESTDGKVTFENLIKNQDIFSLLNKGDKDLFKMGKFDLKVREYFKDDNQLSFEELEKQIYEKYKKDNKIDFSKADQEIDIIKKRIEKLLYYGYVSYDKDSKLFSFEKEYDSYFKKNEDENRYEYTTEAKEILKIPNKLEFTNYDAKITLGYIDKAEGSLTDDELKNIIYAETKNQKAEELYKEYSKILKDDNAQTYIKTTDDSKLVATEEGKELGKTINYLNKYIKKDMDIESLEKLMSNDLVLKKEVDSQIKSGLLIKENNKILVNPYFKSVNGLLYQIYKENGEINKKELRQILEKNVPNYQAKRQYESIQYRLEEFKKQGYISGDETSYSITAKGKEKKEDILVPQRVNLREKIDYLKDLGLIKGSYENGFEKTAKYENYMRSVALSKELNIVREGKIPKYLEKIIENSNGLIDVQKIEKELLANVRKSEYKADYEKIDVSYGEIRNSLKIDDMQTKTLSNMSITMLNSGLEPLTVKETIKNWNTITKSNIPEDKIDEIVERNNDILKENALWEKTTVINPKDFKEMFKSLGALEEDTPKWIYQGKDWTEFEKQSFQNRLGLSMVNNIWKSAFSELERQNIQANAQAQMMKKQADKQLGMNKQAMKEMSRKNKASTLYQDEELER